MLMADDFQMFHRLHGDEHVKKIYSTAVIDNEDTH